MKRASRLTDLQNLVIAILADLEPRWVLTGGAALAGVHLGHRTTRDLDLFWHGLARLDELRGRVEQRLTDRGLSVHRIHGSDTFQRLRVGRGEEVVVVDLVADASEVVEPPRETSVAGVTILVDTPHEILVNKLCALLSRAELRDLIDVRALLAEGGSLERALVDAPKKDAGFSPATLAWVLRELPVRAMCRVADIRESADLEAFRDKLAVEVARAAAPDE